MVKNLPEVRETQFRCLGREDPLEKEMATHCSILTWRIQWTEEPGGAATVHGVAKTQTWLSWVTNIHLIWNFWKWNEKHLHEYREERRRAERRCWKCLVSVTQEPGAGQGETPWHPPGCLRSCSRCPWRLRVLSVPPDLISADWKKQKGMYICKTEGGLGLFSAYSSPRT